VSAGPPAGGTPVKGGTLRIGFVTAGSAESFSLLTGGLAGGNVDFARMYALYDALVGAAPGGRASPALATSWESSSDAKTWTFHLRHGVTFHSGKSFGADDVLYTIQHSWANPKNIYNAVLTQVMDFKGVRKRDQYTIEIPLKIGVADFPTLISFPQCLIAQSGTTNWSDGNGTGAYVLGTFHPGVQSVFSGNKNYWQEGMPHVDQFVINSSYTTDTDRFNALLAGQIDIVPNADPALATANASNSAIVIGNQPGPGFNELGMHVANGLFSNPSVREAFHLIPSRPKYAEVALDGYGTLGNDCPGQTNRYWASSLKSTQDLDKAKSLLKSAGHEGLTLTLKTSALVPGMVEFATLFKQDAAGAGVTINIEQIPTSTFETSATGLYKRTFEVNFWSTGVNSLAQYYITSALPNGPYNVNGQGSGNATFGPNNSLLFDALAEKDPSAAEQKWLEVQKIMSTSGSSVIPAFTNWVDAYSSKVRGVETSSVLNCNNFNFNNGWLQS
jgi:peptide/nickel transport system substrate-binding protein